jgi:predicted MPP superfamily phosphohydrolase
MRFSGANSRWAAAALAAEAPDLVALTGDFVSYDHAIEELAETLAPLAAAPAPLGMFAVPGNHDYWEGLPAIRRALAPLGIEFLMNARRTLRRGGADLVLVGVDDQWNGQPDLAAALDGAPRDAFTLLLAHCPDMADEAAERGVSLQLSGHTHGGHVRLPVLGALCLPRHGWRYPAGHEHVGATQVYVSRGIGGLPLRLGCPPEATIITLRRG